MGQDSDLKSQLVTEICSISKRSIACSHRHGSNTSLKSSFIDWYRLLRVQENAGPDVIRKRYRELALQLHPDKNKHPKAEIAFKLVSEAYSCLSDTAKRKAFDVERWRKFCFECGSTSIQYSTPHKPPSDSEHKALNPTRSCKVVRGLKDMRNRFREEARVIENCLRAKSNVAAPRSESSSLFSPPDYHVFESKSSSRESPIFNPSDHDHDHDHKVQGYPHLRTRIYDKPQNFWCLRTGHQILRYQRGRPNYDSPVFEVTSETRMFKTRSACVPS